jgi:hypothetical protein
VHNLAFEQVGNGCETYVRVRPNGDTLSRREFGRAHVVEEYEWPDRAPLCRWQNATHRKLAEVPFLGSNYHFDASVSGEIGHW